MELKTLTITQKDVFKIVKEYVENKYKAKVESVGTKPVGAGGDWGPSDDIEVTFDSKSLDNMTMELTESGGYVLSLAGRDPDGTKES